MITNKSYCVLSGVGGGVEISDTWGDKTISSGYHPTSWLHTLPTMAYNDKASEPIHGF